jgi:tetratricopeptide (TPR) repeat protein
MSGSVPVRGKSFDEAAFDYLYIEGIKLKLIGNSGEALRYFEESLKLKPESDAANYQIAQILFSSGDMNNGIAYMLKALKINPENIWYNVMLAGAYYQTGRIDSTIILYEKAVSYHPDKEDLQMTLGRLYSENRNFDKAQGIFDSFDSKYGINEASTLASVRNMVLAGNYKEALPKALMLSEEFPEEIMYKGLLAEIYRGAGLKEEAVRLYDSLLAENPDNPETVLSLSDFMIEEGSYEDLLILLNTIVLNENIRKEDKISVFGRLIEDEKFTSGYGEQFRISIMVLEAAYPEDDLIMILRPELLIKIKQEAEAINRLEEIIKEKPANYFAWEKLLLAYFELNDFKTLEAKASIAASKFNRSFLAKILLAAAATENKNFDIALSELNKAQILAGNDKELQVQVLSIRADVYFKKGEYEKAYSVFDEALKINNSDLTVLNNYAYYLAENNLRLKDAEKMSFEVISRERENTTFLDTYAWVLYKRGKLREAERIMEEIVGKAEEPDPEWLEHYGYILKKRRKCSEAVPYWKKALELDKSKVHLYDEIIKCSE